MSEDSLPLPEPAPPSRDAVPTLSDVVRTFLVVALGSGSFFLSIAQCLFGSDPSQFFSANQSDLKPRLVALGVSGLSSALVAAFVLWRAERSENPATSRPKARLLFAPLVVSSFVPVLFFQDAWRDREIAFLTYLLAVALAFERLLRPALETAQPWLSRQKWLARVRQLASSRYAPVLPFVLVGALALAYILRIGHLTVISHIKLATSSSDLAEYDNLFFNALNGHPFRAPGIAGDLENWSNLRNHAEFGLYVLLPFYALAPGAKTLLWIQSAVVGLTAIPIFLLGKLRLGPTAGLCFAVAFLLAPVVQQPNFYDFHFTPLAMFFVAWMLYFAGALAAQPTSRFWRAALYVSMALALTCREDISIGVAVFGLFLLLKGTLVREGIILGVVAGVYFVTLKFGIMPLFGRWWFDTMYDDLKAPGAKGFGSVVLTLVSNPSYVIRTLLTEPKLLYVLHMTVPVLALWLRRPLLWLAFLPGLVQSLLVTNRPPHFQSSFQYTYLWLPYVFAASILAVRRGLPGASTLVALLLAGASLSHQMGVFPQGDSIVGGFSRKTFDVTEAERKRYDDLMALIDMIPPDASVAVTESEGPHVSTRLTMFSLKFTLGTDPEYLLVSRPRHRGEVQHVRTALESGQYGVIARRGPFFLVKRGADPSKNDALWRRLGQRPPSREKPRQK